MKLDPKRGLTTLARLVVGGVFVVASIDKIVNPHEFAQVVDAYEFFPLATVNLIAIVVPWLEVVVGLMLIGGLWLRSTALVAAVMLTGFIVILAWALGHGLEVSCGCYDTTGGSVVSWNRVIEDVGLLGLSIWIFMFPHSYWVLSSFRSRQTQQELVP